MNILKNAGLTNLQSRVYLGLLTLGKADASRLSRYTEVDRSNVYKTLKDLEKFELVEKYIGTSTIYKPVPLQIASLILSGRKKHEYMKSVNDLNILAKEIDSIENLKSKQKKDYFKILPSGTESFSRNWEKTLKTITKSVDLIVTEHREIKDEPIWDIYDDLLQKGVKVRWIFDRSEGNDQEFILRIKQFEKLLRYPNLKIKSCYNCLRPFGGILDNNFAVIFLDKGPHLKCVRSLWTNNSEIVLNFRKHFDSCWKKSVSCPAQKTFF